MTPRAVGKRYTVKCLCGTIAFQHISTLLGYNGAIAVQLHLHWTLSQLSPGRNKAQQKVTSPTQDTHKVGSLTPTSSSSYPNLHVLDEALLKWRYLVIKVKITMPFLPKGHFKKWRRDRMCPPTSDGRVLTLSPLMPMSPLKPGKPSSPCRHDNEQKMKWGCGKANDWNKSHFTFRLMHAE